ncbi:TonB-dependent receptor [Duganella sp. FT3S]|uniref:TonB-dependent receptor n=1 Tax=Rugamonas fusca TaxID=2758568 RepID=A0A7W2EI34_9BURK|nr:TonB-dependent receptor [Rugamonas fusca]MBA5606192.1 TonB-dependent receptor [Rugamonas fusca]
MKSHHTPIAAALLAAFACAPALADDAIFDSGLQEVVIKGEKRATVAPVVTTESITASQIEASINAVTAAEVLNYLPSMHVRERYAGDRNGVLVMRVNSSISSAQTTVYADDLLLSNFLNNSFSTAPRWGMVAPVEIERVDVLYGPFSALYPGNSAGGVVMMSTHMPERFEAHAGVDLFSQDFKLYGTSQHYNGSHASAAIGNKAGAWSYWITADHLDNHGQPQTFGAAAKASPKSGTAYTAVTGELRDTDTSGNPRIITSAIGADHTTQDTDKIKLAYDVTPTVRAMYTLGVWQNKSNTDVAAYLRDGAGNPVYNTAASGAGKYVKFTGDSNYYTLAGTSPGYSESRHLMHGLSLKSDTGGTWDWEAIASLYTQDMDRSRSAANTASLTDAGTGAQRPAGTLTVADGTGWRNLDLRGTWRADGTTASAHILSFGYHVDRYTLKSVTSAVPSDWLYGDAAATPSSNSYGKTETQALYLQDAWHMAPAWRLVAGARAEHWRAFDGSNYNAANVPAYQQLNYAARSSTDISPKLGLSWLASADWTLRAALGKAVRYPTVAEIFQVISLPNNVKQNDPNLKPERVVSGEVVAERHFQRASLRSSLFWEAKRDALIAQSDVTVTPNISSIQNVDKVRTYGVEEAFDARDWLVRGLDLNGSATWTRSTITADSRNPGLVGTDQPRIPDWRATLVATWHATERLALSLSYRYSGRQHNALYNTAAHQYNDVNPDVYGAVSHYSVFDAKLLYNVNERWSAALGVNNLGNFKYYVNPNPYPQRTVFASLKYDL